MKKGKTFWDFLSDLDWAECGCFIFFIVIPLIAVIFEGLARLIEAFKK